ncbi:MAG: protein kinase domain-containing protein [Planctomycetota bacterium]|jgi:serine/threonine-protein kinase
MSEPEEKNDKRPGKEKDRPTASFSGSAPGEQIGPFRIERELGRGAVGVVYLAHDTKLDRSVAIKSLPAEVMANPKARSRFSREARVLASLNHPNIATIYEEVEEAEGVVHLILEYIPGQTLAEQIAKKPLKLEEALTIALQIAEAVAAAHEHNVIHRDLKPGNIKITPEGKVKVLDFGLAKAVGGEALDQQSTVTEPGRVIGTPAYMSPEQARGKPADKRSDIWSFGCVLYEMLTGKIPFKGETISDTLANILQTDPNWQALPQTTPANIRSLLRHCLKKDPRRRLQHIGDADIEISETLSSLTVSVETVEKMRPVGLPRLIAWAAACLILAVAVTGLVTWSLTRSKPPASPVVSRFVVQPHSKIADEALFHHALAISPDGKRIAYVDQGPGTERLLYVRELSASKARAIPGTEGAIDPFFSPDSESLGYSDHTRGALEVVSIRGGSPRKLSETLYLTGGVWLDDGTIIFSPGAPETGLWSISAAGGTSEPLTTLDLEEGEVWHAWPSVLPNNNILFASYRRKEGIRESRLEVVSRAGGTRHVVLDGGVFGRYLPSGHLIFVRNDSLLVARFDPKSLTLQSKPVPLPERALHNPGNCATQLVCSNTGILAYIPAPSSDRKLVWVDDRGLVEPLAAPDRAYNSVSLAPDGTQIALSIESQAFVHTDIWLYDIARVTLTQLTFNGLSMLPQWMDNSRQLTYVKYDPPERMFDLLCLYTDGSRDEELLARVSRHFSRGYSINKEATSLLVPVSLPQNDQNIVAISLKNGEHTEKTVVDDAGWQRWPVFSPDGRWFAYSSHETGTWEVYVKPFTGPGAKTKISDGGGYEPLWDPYGNKLYYRNGDEMWMVTYEAGEKFEPAQPKFLFERHFLGGLAAKQKTYCTAKDGRFLMIHEDLAPGTQINVVLNWFEELKRLMPPGENR